jgi:SAM-dependent methyltransferase
MDRMPPVPENRARPTDPPRDNDYDVLAEAYAADNESSLFNAYYERPATLALALAGDVAGRRILDAGCGSGPLFAVLRDRGAIVTGFDPTISPPTAGPRTGPWAACSSSCTPAKCGPTGRPLVR